MNRGPIRRGQLVSPFGVGAMSTLVNGTSIITAGLDAWFNVPSGSELYLEEFTAPATDPRLLKRLRVDELRLPPDFRSRRRQSESGGKNEYLTVPALRFPGWNFCPWLSCRRLQKTPLTRSETVRCDSPIHEGWKSRPIMHQVPFIAICSSGHLSDFPFREWAHKSSNPSCDRSMSLRAAGSGSLAGQVVQCECGAKRTLGRILEGGNDVDGQETSFVSDNLIPGNKFLCQGSKPWTQEYEDCSKPLRGALRGSGNVYFPKIETSIFLPNGNSPTPPDLVESLRKPQVESKLSFLAQIGMGVSVADVRKLVPSEYLLGYEDDVVAAAIDELLGTEFEDAPSAEESCDEEELNSQALWRAPEYSALGRILNFEDLRTSDPGMAESVSGHFQLVHKIESLRETRALRGFTRLRDSALSLEAGKASLQRSKGSASRTWLPAFVVRGEGIFFEFREDRLAAWEATPAVERRIEKLASKHDELVRSSGDSHVSGVSARLVLLHTFAHVMINQLIFSCGYSSASLRERIYVHDEQMSDPMAGVLIYTAAGDSEGTMGGLVRMANQDNLEKVFAAAISESEWCASDPICMDLGRTGQGPDGCNLAAWVKSREVV